LPSLRGCFEFFFADCRPPAASSPSFGADWKNDDERLKRARGTTIMTVGMNDTFVELTGANRNRLRRL
jgi:hypothetical protein